MAIKLKYDKNNDAMDLYRDNNIITTLNDQEFGSLVREVMRIMEEANPKIKRRSQRRAEQRMLKNQLKILLAVRAIGAFRVVKGWLYKIKMFFTGK